MNFRSAFALTAALALSGLVAGAKSANAGRQQAIPPGSTPKSSAVARTTGPTGQITAGTQLLLVRDVDGEFAKAVRAIPAGRKGFRVEKANNPQDLSDALRLYGTVANPGDTVQITRLDFDAHAIRVEINGGGRKHFNWRQHLQVGVGNLNTPPPSSDPQQPTGGVLVVDFGQQNVPNLSSDQLKADLAPFLDFSKHSASVNWVDTLPPQFQQGIKDHHAIVGMDHDMVIAALGLPDKKIREWDEEGHETEDWIYGLPPAPSTFVTFIGENVVRVKQYAMEDASDR
ncbi:MAG: hypothetical protein KGL02_13715 [Acidobacteriota bacterium]|nr:hypothetical protein [Acidobacteriota bacterium]